MVAHLKVRGTYNCAYDMLITLFIVPFTGLIKWKFQDRSMHLGLRVEKDLSVLV